MRPATDLNRNTAAEGWTLHWRGSSNTHIVPAPTQQSCRLTVADQFEEHAVARVHSDSAIAKSDCRKLQPLLLGMRNVGEPVTRTAHLHIVPVAQGAEPAGSDQ